MEVPEGHHQKNNIKSLSVCPPSPTRSISSIDTGYLSEDSANCSLGDALKDQSDFHFDMSDRWKEALVTTLDDPIYPDEPELVDEPTPPPSAGLGLHRLFLFRGAGT